MSNAGVTTIANDAVTYAKVQNIATANRVLGSASADGIVSEVQVATDMIANDAVTDAKIATSIDAIKLADGSVTNTELQYIGTLSSDAQTQINTLSSNGSTNTSDITAINTLADGKIYLGDGNNDAKEVTLTGNVTMSNAGVTTIANDCSNLCKSSKYSNS